MSSTGRQSALATAEDLLRLPAGVVAEVIDGEIVEKAAPAIEHGQSQASITQSLGPFRRRPGGRAPGGWYVVTGVGIEYEAHEVYRHAVPFYWLIDLAAGVMTVYRFDNGVYQVELEVAVLFGADPSDE